MFFLTTRALLKYDIPLLLMPGCVTISRKVDYMYMQVYLQQYY